MDADKRSLFLLGFLNDKVVGTRGQVTEGADSSPDLDSLKNRRLSLPTQYLHLFIKGEDLLGVRQGHCQDDLWRAYLGVCDTIS